MNNLNEETIKLRGNSGKAIEMTIEELASKKLAPKVVFKGDTFYAMVTHWYRIDKDYKSLALVTSDIIKLIQKIDLIKMNNKPDELLVLSPPDSYKS